MTSSYIVGRPRLYASQRKKPSFQRLLNDICEVLFEKGPLSMDELRERLCVASKQQLDAAITDLCKSHRIQRRGLVLRLAGDIRPFASRRHMEEAA